MRVGPIVSSDVFYNSDEGSTSAGPTAACSRWRWRLPSSSRSARSKVAAGCLTVSDVVVEEQFVRITDDEMKAAVDQMTELALAVATDDH